jgi:hypothetical protein
MDGDEVARIAAAVVDWASGLRDVSGLAMVGSWASARARSDSDLDFVFIADRPDRFRQDRDWLSAIAWGHAGFAVSGFRDASYGVIWSRHVALLPAADVELSFAPPSWASTDPIDRGTRDVIARGCRILLDEAGAFAALMAALGN